MRPFQALCKLLQRQTYSCLSTRSGIWFCLGGLILLAISAFQFGEVLLEWSMQKYNVAFSADHDNIAGKTFQSRLCLPGPIDVVYTWVNGSDPVLISELNKVKSQLMSQLNLTVMAKNEKGKEKTERASNKAKPGSKRPKNTEERFKWNDENACPYPNCVPFNAIAVSGLPRNISEFLLSIENTFLPGFQFSNFENSVDPSVKVLVFRENFNIETLKNHTVKFKNMERKFSRVFVSSTIRMGASKVDGIGIINYVPKDMTIEMIENALHREKINEVSISITSNVSVIKFDNLIKAKQFLGPMRGKIKINGHKFKMLPATFIWKPLTPLEIGRDIIEEDVSTSRFADNEELRYSLRSVEKYAPWIRNIYIVTNGQIPSWLNLDHPRIKVVTHEEIFSNKSHLPTFSSPAIETHIHKIPGLSKQFIYMNDDVFFGDYVWPDDFYTHSSGQKLYLTWPVPNCNEGCPASWVNDKYCDKPCNVSECDWDGGDCLNTQGKSGFPSHSIPNFFGGHGYSAIGEYCNGGCANSWIGDRYCDANCNVPNCGYDAGDCGILKFKDMFSIDAAHLNGVLKIPVGIKAFFINFTSILNDGILSEGDYVESTVIRAAIFSKKFKTMTVTFYANFTATVPFSVSGFKDKNQTIPVSLNFSISVDTSKEPLTTTAKTSTKKINKVKASQKPYTVYNIVAKKHKQSEYDEKSVHGNKTMNEVFEWYKATKRDIPLEVVAELNKTEIELKDGYLTENGYNKRKFQIIHPFYESNGNQSLAINQGQLPRIRRHLLSHFNPEEPSSKDQMKAGAEVHSFHQKSLMPLKIIDGPRKTDDKTRKRRKLMPGGTNLRRWISKYGYWDPLKDVSSTSPHRWERQNFFADVTSAHRRLELQKEYMSKRKPGRVLLDTFASSLLHVSRIYNRAFGYKARKVPAHMPHFVDVGVINEMQKRFMPYFDETSSHKIRREDDMQFAFSYAYYSMDVPALINMSMVFHELDTDATNTLSETELRTLAARMYSLPLRSADIRNLKAILLNCSNAMQNNSKSSEFSTLVVTSNLIVNCKPIETALKDAIKQKRYKFELIGDEDVTFKMIRNNVSHLIYQLDWIRKNRRKFVCLNDNIDHDNPHSKLIRTILRDFLEYLFPKPSQFELPGGFRNKFLKTSELNKWKEKAIKDEENRKILLYLILILFLIFLARRQFFRLYKFVINMFHRNLSSNRGLNFNETEIVKI